MRDKYNLNTLPPSLAGLEDYEMDEHVVIPGMGMTEDRLEFKDQQLTLNEPPPPITNSQINNSAELVVAINDNAAIPGLDLDVSSVREKKAPYKKPTPKNLQGHWNVDSDEFYGTTAHDSASILTCVRGIVNSLVTRLPGIIPLEELKPQTIQVYGKDIEVTRKLS